MKTYKATVSFGDGKPVETTIKAKNGIEAQDVGFRSYPGARMIHITGVLSVDIPQVPLQDLMDSHPLFGDPLPVVRKTTRTSFRTHAYKDNLIDKATQLRRDGISYARIAEQLGVGKSTIRGWLSSVDLTPPEVDQTPSDVLFY